MPAWRAERRVERWSMAGPAAARGAGAMGCTRGRVRSAVASGGDEPRGAISRGIVHGDEDACFVADMTGRTVRLPTGASDAALAPYHVDRSKLFVVERLDGIEGLDAARIARAIEYTRFPYAPSQTEEFDDLHE